MFFNTLNKFNIVENKPEVGDKFNEKFMKKIGEEKTENQEQKKGTIAKVVNNGW